MYYSELQEWYTNNAFRSFSLKYVVDQCIYYKVGRQEHVVNGSQFMLASKQPHVQAYFHHPTPVKSICIDVCPATVAEAFHSMQRRDTFDFDNGLAGYFQYPDFFESVSPASSSILHGTLHQLVAAIRNGTAAELVTNEWFLQLVEKIICHEYGHYLSLSGLATLKPSTRKETLRRLHLAREYILQEHCSINDVQEVAKRASLSLFHFYRSYRQAFGISPYQHILQLRLERAASMVKAGLSFGEIALLCHFPDLSSFSKAFRKQFGLSPAQYRKLNLP